MYRHDGEYVDQGGGERGGCNAMTHNKIATMQAKINCSKKMIIYDVPF